jgi:hypothetical protein
MTMMVSPLLNMRRGLSIRNVLLYKQPFIP